MDINVNDRVEIIEAGPSEQHLLHKFGTVMMIIDGENCFVLLDDETDANVNVKQLKKVKQA